ncbi:MAG: hypothetical protein MJ156_01505 [Alphaproteobacteria bacterium]|nr:hypothetical protein [Alphaproteobacteria bacterium]
MKNTVVIVSFALLGLVGCDKIETIDFKCPLPTNYKENDNPLTYTDTTQDVLVKIKTYLDTAIITVDKHSSKFLLSSAEEYEVGFYAIGYTGVFPNSNKEAVLMVTLDTENDKIVQYDINFKSILGKNFSCEPIQKKYKGELWTTNVSFRNFYPNPTKQRKCLEELTYKVSCNGFCVNGNPISGFVYKDILIPKEHALYISSNWDYDHPKIYNINDGINQDYEQDACDVLNRLKEYAENHSYLKKKYGQCERLSMTKTITSNVEEAEYTLKCWCNDGNKLFDINDNDFTFKTKSQGPYTECDEKCNNICKEKIIEIK